MHLTADAADIRSLVGVVEAGEALYAHEHGALHALGGHFGHTALISAHATRGRFDHEMSDPVKADGLGSRGHQASGGFACFR